MATTLSQSSQTERFKKSIGGSMKSLFNGGDRTYFTLEHKTQSEKHKPGETTQFISDYIELGRGDSYAVNFGEDCSTVSRPHAAIVRKKQGWVIENMSQTNPTFVNRNRVSNEWYLNNGDEIQLSTKGPVMAFLIPSNNKVGTLSLTLRMRAVINEAIKPYKATITAIVVVFLALVGGSIWGFQKLTGENSKLKDQITHIKQSFKDSLSAVHNQINHPPVVKQKITPPQPVGNLFPDIYFIVGAKITYNWEGQTGEKEFGISATGFMLDDGRFVTARHVIEPWLFEKDSVAAVFNLMASNGGHVSISLTAISPSGNKIKLTTDDFHVDNSADEISKIAVDGKDMSYTTASPGGNDWAVTKTTVGTGGMPFDKSASSTLPTSTKLYVLGFPFGNGANNVNDIKPEYSECYVARDGLNNGSIDISGRGYDTGSSGGPVLIRDKNGKFKVIGIVSAEQGAQGIICPISSVK